MFEKNERFSFGINMDDPWKYAGRREPKSIILPHLLSVKLPDFELPRVADKLGTEGKGGVAEAAALECRLQAERVAAAGIDFVRIWFPWNFFEPVATKGDELKGLMDSGYPAYPMDQLVEAFTSKLVNVIPVLACGYQRMLPEGLEPDRDPGGYVERAALHAALIVRRYKRKVKIWQIENEPNWWEMHSAGGWRNGAVWLEGGRFRFELLRTLGEAVHREDPDAKTIINLEADSGITDVKTYSQLCDILGLDFYPNYKASTPVDTLPLRAASEVSKEVGSQVIISETGYPSGPGLLGYTETKQAEYVRRTCFEAVQGDGVTGLGIWRLADSSWRSFPLQENHFGLIDEKGREKSAFRVYSDTVKELKKEL
jgi:hypothetical protein